MNGSTDGNGLRWLEAMARSPWWTVVGGTALLLVVAVVAAIAWLARERAHALRVIDVAAPTDKEQAAARQAGAALAARGPLGLVLAGGGAKGAYQIGCWKALRECGVAGFDAIAGCSVGSLNAVLVAQGDLGKAEHIWHEMRFSRVFRLHWHFLIALVIRMILFVPYLGKHMFPARVINVPMWRAVTAYRRAGREGEPGQQLHAVLQLFLTLARRPGLADRVGELVLYGAIATGVSWYVLAAPLLTLPVIFIVLPVMLFFLVVHASWLAAFLDQLSTRLVLATNEPLHRLLIECVDVGRLKSRDRPLFVTLASLREVTRTKVEPPPARRHKKAPSAAPPPAPAPTTGLPGWWHRNVIGENGDYSYRGHGDSATASPVATAPVVVTTIEYVPTHFDVRKVAAKDVNELVLQSAGLPEMFPARKFGDDTYVDGGIADLVPVSALADVPGLAAIVVLPLDAQFDEAAVREKLAATLERLGRAADAPLPELVVLTPSQPLGGFFTGTLDFAAVRARALLAMGYRDTIRAMARRATSR